MFGSILRFVAALALLALAQGIVWSAGTSLLGGTDVGRNAALVAVAATVWLLVFTALSRALRLAARARARASANRPVHSPSEGGSA